MFAQFLRYFADYPDNANPRPTDRTNFPSVRSVGVVRCSSLNPCTCCSSSKVLFFPDPKLPCITFYRVLMDESKAKCWKQDCKFAHYTGRPGEKMTSLMEVFSLVSKAQYSLDLAMYLITHEWLAKILIYLHRKGVTVRVITDAGFDTSRRQRDQSETLQKAGITVKANYTNGSLMHNKFVIIDDSKLILGSFNWTTNAILKNDEAIMINSQSSIVSKFSNKFQQLWISFDHRREQIAPMVQMNTGGYNIRGPEPESSCVIM